MAKILIVDDVYTTRLKTELVLRHAVRYEVASVASGAEALERVTVDQPDAIVLDIVMAGMDGIATLRELRRQGITCPIIAFTSRTERSPGEFVTRGFDGYVAKSENLSGLIATIRDLLKEEAVETTAETPSPRRTSIPSQQRAAQPTQNVASSLRSAVRRSRRIGLSLI